MRSRSHRTSLAGEIERSLRHRGAIGPLILVYGITMMGLEMWERLYESVGFDMQLTTSD